MAMGAAAAVVVVLLVLYFSLGTDSAPGWLAVLKSHFGAIARGEYSASSAECRMVRFGRAPGMRNMATFGMMDEIRHSQIQLFFPHQYVSKDRQFDWAFKAYDTNEWAMLAARHFFDDMMVTRGAVGVGLVCGRSRRLVHRDLRGERPRLQ